jgi:hypothetical protein
MDKFSCHLQANHDDTMSFLCVFAALRLGAGTQTADLARLLLDRIRERYHKALAHGLGMAHKGFHGGVGALPGFELRER